MDDKIFDQIHDVDLKETMERSYIDYAMSVIAARALPDVRVLQLGLVWPLLDAAGGGGVEQQLFTTGTR